MTAHAESSDPRRGAPSAGGDILLSIEHVTKTYAAVTANDDVSLDVRRGHIHAILGENGAGKSTLMKIIYGVTAPDAGTIRWKGEAVAIRSPAHARRLGIGMVFQHFALFETMTVAENISLAMPHSVRRVAQQIRDIGGRLSLEVDPDRPVHALSVGERQRVEIIRCLLLDPDLIIMDEPTAVLPPSKVPALFETLRRLAEEGRAILFISHKLEEIQALCHTATIMRNGRIVATVDPTMTKAGELAHLMIGHELPHVHRAAAAALAEPVLVVEDVNHVPDDPFGVALEHVRLAVRAGEVVGIAGISGNGQAELVRILSGETPLPAHANARVQLRDVPVGALGARHRRRLGLSFVPEDRQGRATVPALSLASNALLTGADKGLVGRGTIRFNKVRDFARSIIDRYDVRCSGPRAAARSLSGGNLQKFIVGREIELAPQFLLVAQPTWGVDVGAAAAIRQKLLDLAAQGLAILVVSDELDELIEITDRLHVMFRGRLSASAATRSTARDAIGLAMTGSFAALEGAGPVPEPQHA